MAGCGGLSDTSSRSQHQRGERRGRADQWAQGRAPARVRTGAGGHRQADAYGASPRSRHAASACSEVMPASSAQAMNALRSVSPSSALLACASRAVPACTPGGLRLGYRIACVKPLAHKRCALAPAARRAALRCSSRLRPAMKELPYVPTEQEIRAFYEMVWTTRRATNVLMIKTLLDTACAWPSPSASGPRTSTSTLSGFASTRGKALHRQLRWCGVPADNGRDVRRCFLCCSPARGRSSIRVALGAAGHFSVHRMVVRPGMCPRARLGCLSRLR